MVYILLHKLRFCITKIFSSDKFVCAPYDKGMGCFIYTKFLKFNKGNGKDHEYTSHRKINTNWL